jgi:hypothetical protein
VRACFPNANLHKARAISSNFMKKYTIKVVSQTNAIAFVSSSFIIYCIVAGAFLPALKSQFPVLVYFILGVLPFVVAVLLWQKCVTGKTEWIVDDNGFSIKWTKPFFLANNKDIYLTWKEVKKLSIGLDPRYFTYKIRLVCGEKLKIRTTSRIFVKDDLREFNEVFQSTYLKIKKLTKENYS